MSTILSARCSAILLLLGGMSQVSIPTEVVAQARSSWPADLPAPDVVSRRVDSLERAALMSDNHDRQFDAALALLRPGTWWHRSSRDTVPPAEIRYPGIVARVARVYRESRDNGVRRLILRWMPYQAERTEAVAFLEEAAQEAPRESPPSPPPSEGVIVGSDGFLLEAGPTMVVSVLADMGPEGQTALRRLHANGTVRDSWARAALEKLASQGFRRPRK